MTLITRPSGMIRCSTCGSAGASAGNVANGCLPAAAGGPAVDRSAPGMMTIRLNRDDVSAGSLRSLAK
jgi:hypothetical protein